MQPSSHYSFRCMSQVFALSLHLCYLIDYNTPFPSWEVGTGGTYYDETFLSQKAASAAPDDLPAAQELLDTLTAHKGGCAGMAVNMTGVNKRIIVFDNEGKYIVMFNPEILLKF